MKLKEFFYDLPKELIAQYALEKRDQARLMIVNRKNETIRHDIFAHLSKYLPENSSIVLNDSKVVPARLLGRREKTEGKVEIFLLKKIKSNCYQALIRPLGRLNLNEKIIFNGGNVTAQILDFKEKIVRFNKKDITKYLEKEGHMPLPPYIKREDTKRDRLDYQTVFARKRGSVASPTAGLHFTRGLLNQLKREGKEIQKVTLHINHATFKPVEAEDIRDHKMFEEEYDVTPFVWENIQKGKERGRKIIAVGTTSTRVLETVALNGKLKASTNIFIYPGYCFKMVDALITNFHLPCSTLLMLVYAFACPACPGGQARGGVKLMRQAYQEAIDLKYRFYSYGDCMLIL